MLKSLNQILRKVENNPQWHGPYAFQRLLQVWPNLVGLAVAQHTRPCSISRDVLYVATSSSVWVQELQFKRRVLLKKINACVSLSVTDLRFSTSAWQNVATATRGEKAALLWQEHPSLVTETAAPIPKNLPPDAEVVFENWANSIKERSQDLPLCSQCQCPTPPGELERWGVCGLCVIKKWRG